ncbi:MAG TPA: HAMP domain-containing sensor histidine kinase [Nitrososphaeraceae archaeon]|nr:HAMP domain-containing sensor histidine kinase [Nitrososphaeraceae archaeon]
MVERFTEDDRTTKVLYGVETVVNTIIEFLNRTNDAVFACVDQTRPILTLETLGLKNAFLYAKKRGVKLHYVTEITKDNLSYCKQLMDMVDELRHLDGIKGNFYVSESGYLAPATAHEVGRSASQVIYSNVTEIIEHQRYVFDSFWNKAIQAGDRIREIEEGIDLAKTEVIHSPQKIMDTLLDMTKSARHEILLILPTINAFLREERIGTFELLKNSILEKNVIVRIITPINDQIEALLQNVSVAMTNELPPERQGKDKKRQGDLQVQRSTIQFKETAVTTVTILVIDRKVSLAIEKTDDSKPDFMEAVGLSTYSNSEPTVVSYVSIFEALWKQAELVNQLEAHDKLQREFINIASHEMKTPTQAILGYSELLETDPKNNTEIIVSLKRNANRLQRLTNDILEVSRIESQTLKLNKEKVNINEKIREIIDDVGSQVQNPNDLRIIFSETKRPVHLQADKTRLYQVIANLLTNAIKFTNVGTITVSAEVNDNNNELIVTVKDSGEGIHSDIIPRLFTKFVTRSNVGTGLGLYISKNIIEAHGGRIWAENNRDGKGANFTFTLPLSPVL